MITLKNTLAYCAMEINILEDKPVMNFSQTGFMIFCNFYFQMENSGLYYKRFTIIIYDRNDSSQYYKTMITIVTYAPSFA